MVFVAFLFPGLTSPSFATTRSCSGTFGHGCMTHDIPVYENNGGAVLAVAGDDYVVVAADTRLSKGLAVLSSACSRLWELCPGVWLGVGGCLADTRALAEAMQDLCEGYRFEHGRAPGVDSVAQALSSTLYTRRQTPYYTFCILAGLDQIALSGALFTYDAVGNIERVRSACAGSCQSIIVPILDQLLSSPMTVTDGQRPFQASAGKGATHDDGGLTFFQHWSDGGLCATAARPACTSWLTPHAAVEGMKGAATTAGERNILLGDGLEIVAVIPKATKDVASKGTSHEACITKWKIRAQL